MSRCVGLMERPTIAIVTLENPGNYEKRTLTRYVSFSLWQGVYPPPLAMPLKKKKKFVAYGEGVNRKKSTS